MDPKARRNMTNLRSENARLSAQSFSLYRGILANLLQHHSEYTFLKPLSVALRSNNWREVYSAADSLSRQQYLDATLHLVANQFSLPSKKYPWEPSLIGTDPLGAAEESFFKAERRCKRVNSKFEILLADPSQDRLRGTSRAAMRWIRGLLGSEPPHRRIFRECEFGQGASVGVHGDATHIVRKLSSKEWTVTASAIHHGFGGLMKNHHFMEVFLPRGGVSNLFSYDYVVAFKNYIARTTVVKSNKISFVPKTAATFRSIAVEPLVNGYVQKGIDLVMRAKLKSAGIDLSDQSLNQRMARLGSLDDTPEGFVTLDLKGASNSISSRVVEYLLPREWFDLLNKTRSRYYAYRGVEKPYNMFCSMGNGFCFPLETIIFASVCHACDAGDAGVDWMVYGDDIIVRRKSADEVIRMLKHLGFTLNADKSFIEGPFRESCGADWFRGEDVRPFTLDYALDSVQNIFKFCNLTQRSEKVSDFFRPVRRIVTDALDPNYRFFRPLPGQDDSAITSLGDEHLTSPHCKFRKENATWEWKVVRTTPICDLDCMKEFGSEPWLMGVTLRGSVPISFGVLSGLPEVVFRRKTRAMVARESYSSTSNWLPYRYN
jgi:hypothetical protein